MLLAGATSLPAQTNIVPGRIVSNFNQSWKFELGDYAGAQTNGYNDTLWNNVGLPHSFDIPYFGWNQFYTGYGWYRKHFTITTNWTGKRVFLQFEAAFQDAQVYVNGQFLGEHLGGYTGFFYELTTNLVVGDNVVAVRLNNNWNPQVAPRTGDHTFIGGLYRNVWLVATDPVHVTWYGTWVTTPTVSAASGTVNIQTEICNNQATNVPCTVQTAILDANSNVVATVSSTQTLTAGTTNTFNQTTAAIPNPQLWSPATPYVYSAATTVLNGTNVVDTFNTTFGFRWFQWTAANGFYLNGSHLYFHGADVHQDHAGWSDAVAGTASVRDVIQIKQAGLNFIRGSHYPHADAFVNACDTNGICLWSEFCMWGCGGTGEGGWDNSSAYPTVTADQAPFEANVHQGLTEEIRILRNHPSIVVWSMCNEPFFTDSSVMNSMSNLLSEEVAWTHQLDPNRPAAIGGCQRPDNSSGRIDKIGDVAGYNGDGATIGMFQNSGVPSMVTEYGSVKATLPGTYSPGWGNLSTQLAANGLPTEYAWRSGQSVWCGFDYGTQLAGGALYGGSGAKGLVDYFRLPKEAWYWYRNQYVGVPPPAWPGGGTPAGLQLTASTTNLTAVDGTQDAQVIVSVLDANGNATSNSVPVTLTLISGPGQFPTGTNITFTPPTANQVSDIEMTNGEAAIEFRTYYSGTSVIQATSPGLTPATVTITSAGSPVWVPGVTPAAPTLAYKRFNGSVVQPPMHSDQLALNRPTLVSSTGTGSSGYVDDGATNTYWQAAATDTNAWWQINLENLYQLDTVQLIFPTADNYCYQIQLSADNVHWTTVVDQSQNTSTEQSRTAVGYFGSGIEYLRVAFTNQPPGLVPGLAEIIVGGGSGLTYNTGQLAGTIIGTDGSSNNITANEKEAAMDWNTNSFFDGPDANGDWVGLDLGTSTRAALVQVGCYPRIDTGTPSFSNRLLGGLFQGANQPNFSDAVTLYTITNAPLQGVMTLLPVTLTNTFRYVRYVSGTNGFANVAELEFFGNTVTTTTTNTVWTGAVNGTWDTTTANWLTAGVAGIYADGQTVQFDDTATGTTTVSLSATRTPLSLIVNNTAKTYALSGSAIAGTGGLTKSGTGSLTLSAANTFSGPITVNNGTLIATTTVGAVAGTSSPLGNSGGAGRLITINGPGVLDLQINNVLGQPGPNKNPNPPAVVINGGRLQVEKVSNLIGALTLNGGTLSANSTSATLNYAPSPGYENSYLSYQLGGNLTITGSAPSYITNSQPNFTTGQDGLSLMNGLNTFTVASVTGSTGVDLTVSAAIGDVNTDYNYSTRLPGVLDKAGPGRMLLSGLNFYDGGTIVSAGTLVAGTTDGQTLPADGSFAAKLNAAGAFGKPGTPVFLGDAGTAANNSSPTLLIGGPFTVAHPIIVTNLATTGVYTLGGAVDTNAAFTGAITLNQPLTLVQAADAGTNGLTLAGGLTAGTAGLKTLTVAGPGNIAVTTAPISDGSGQLAVNVTGGTLTLAAVNTSTGPTTVTNGTLLVNGSVAAGGSMAIGTGGTLGGAGTISSPVTITSGGTLAPGGATTTLTLTAGLTLSPGATTFLAISKAPATNTVVNVTGTLTYGGTLSVTNLGPAAPAEGDRFPLFNAATSTGTFAALNLPPLPVGLGWNTNNLTTTGVLSIIVTSQPMIKPVILAPNGLVIGGAGGVANANYILLGSTNLIQPASNWTRLLTNQFDNYGNFNFTNPLNTNGPQHFYRLQVP